MNNDRLQRLLDRIRRPAGVRIPQGVATPEVAPPEEAEIGQIGRLIRQERERLGLRHADVGDRAKLDASFLSRIETDPEANPTLDTLRRIAAALGKRLACRFVDLPTRAPIAVASRSGDDVRQHAIDCFIEGRGTTPYEMAYPDLARERVEQIAEEYFPRLRQVTDEEVEELLSTMRRSIEANSDHGRIEEWRRCCHGVAEYLLRPGDLDGLHRVVAAEVVIRLSGYVHHGAELYARFREAAQRIAETIWTRHGIDLPYIKIPEHWSSTIPTEDDEGYVMLWDFAGQQRALASRMLCFICLHGYGKVYIPEEDHRELEREFHRDRNLLMRWSVSSEYVDQVARSLVVPRQGMIDFLTRNRFNQSQMYKPSAAVRERWFKDWKHAIPG